MLISVLPVFFFFSSFRTVPSPRHDPRDSAGTRRKDLGPDERAGGREDVLSPKLSGPILTVSSALGDRALIN